MRVPTRLVSVAVLAAALAVSGCKSPEEKAEEFYLSGVEYVKAEDPARAMIQFRNALLHVPDHLDAALAQARLLETQGDLAGAQAAYAAVSETRPDDLALRHRLVGMSLRRGDWEEVERFAQAILARAPESAEGQVARVALDYRAAKQTRAPDMADDAAKRALALRESRPDDTVLLRVALDWYSDQDDLRPALAILDDVLSRNASDREMQLHRVALLARLGEGDIAGDRLRRMVTLFPDDRRIRGLLVAWLVSVERTDEAESFLRGLAGAPDGERQGHLDVIAFLELHRGVDVALTEIERLIEATDAGPDRRYWSAIQASRAFAAGEQQAATDAMREILEAEEGTTLRFNLQVMLARMLNDVGETDEAASLVDEVLAADPLHADALQMRAMRYLGDGAPQEAVADLRAALAQRPRSPDILMLMARAHMAEGNRDLAGERLATAVQMSAQAPRPSLTYAAFLREGGRGEVAERVLRAALERTPRYGALTAALAELMVERGRFGEAAVLIDRMAETDTPNDAARLHAMRLAAQGREAEGMSFLSSVIRDGGDGLRPVAAVVQTLVRAGRADEAITYLDTALTAQPDDTSLLLLRASVLALIGDVDGATAGLRGLLAGSPGDARAVGLLIPLLRAQGGETEAETVLAAALIASPESRELRLMEASRLEARGEIGSAVEMLKALHGEDSADLVAANNLASLLTRTMPGPVAPEAEAIEAARSAARVLRGLPSPAFQDTYGWVEFLRGNLGEALSYLEPAAQAMPGDPRVQYHLGRVYEALGRDEAAASQFARVAELDASAALPETESALGRLDAQ